MFISLLVAIQLLLRKKAAEELKKEQERKSAERRRIIEERCGKPKDLENASEGIVENFLVILISITISPSVHSTLESIIIDYYMTEEDATTHRQERANYLNVKITTSYETIQITLGR